MTGAQHYVEVVRYRLDGRMTLHETHGPYPAPDIADRVAEHLRGVVNSAEFFVRVVSHA